MRGWRLARAWWFAGLLALALILSAATRAGAATSTFTYHGRLTEGGQAAEGAYDFQFALVDAATAGQVVAGPVTRAPVAVRGGLFLVDLDFAAEVFNGSPLWLEIGVRTNGSTGAYVVLAPRQEVRATPYAVFAARAGEAAVASNLVAGAVLRDVFIEGASIQPGTLTSNQFDSATDAAYRATDTNAVLALAHYTNSATIYVDPNGYDEGVRGMPSRPWNNPTNAFPHIQDGDTVVLRGSWVLPATAAEPWLPSTRGCVYVDGKSNVTILGYGATLKFVGPGLGMTVSNVTHFKMLGLTLAGDRSPHPNVAGVLCFNGTNAFVEIAGCTIRDCFDQGITLMGSGAYGTDNLWIHDNYFYNIGTTNIPNRPDIPSGIDGSCISGFVGGNQWICNNRADNVVRFWEFENAGAPYENRVYSNVNILNNTVTGCIDWGILSVGRTLNNVLIAGNKIFRAPNSPSPSDNNSVAILSPGTNIVIRDNIFEGSGILVMASSHGHIDRVVIENNVIRNPGLITIQAAQFYDVLRVEVRHNHLAGAYIPLQIGSVDTTILGNTFENFGVADLAACLQVITGGQDWLSGRARRLVVRGNRILSTGPGTGLVAYELYKRSVLPDEVLWQDNEMPPEVALSFEPMIKAGKFLMRAVGEGSPAGAIAASSGSSWRDITTGAFYFKRSGDDASGWVDLTANAAPIPTGPASIALANPGWPGAGANSTPPADPATVKAWLTITNNGQVYKLPLYQ